MKKTSVFAILSLIQLIVANSLAGQYINMEYISSEKLDELKSEIEHLKGTKRKQIAEDLEFAKSLGDLSENAEYSQARDNQAKLEARISQIEHILKNYQVVKSLNNGAINVGSSVTIIKKGSKQEQVFQLVGPEEVDTANGKISYKSPMGESMMGKKQGEEFSFSTPKGEMIYKIKKVK